MSDEGGEAACSAPAFAEHAPLGGPPDGSDDGAVTVWFNPSCSKCRTAQGLLEERGVEATYVEYLQHPPTIAELRRLLVLLGTTDVRAIARRGEPAWSELGLDDATAEEVLAAIAEHPALLERPIVVIGDRAVVARPPERVLELLDR